MVVIQRGRRPSRRRRPLGHQTRAVLPGRERQRPEGDRTAAGDASPRPRSRSRRAPLDRVVERHPRRDATTGEPRRRLARRGSPSRPAKSSEVDVARRGARSHAHERVPVRAGRCRRQRDRRASLEPAEPEAIATHLGAAREVRRRDRGQVPVRRRVREQSADARARPCRSRCRGPTHHRARRDADVEQRDPAARCARPGRARRRRREVDAGCGARSRRSRRRRVRRGTGSCRMSACTRGTPLRSATQHPDGEIDRRSARCPAWQLACTGRRCPLARSRTTLPPGRPSVATVRLRHPTSIRNVMIRLTRSYRGAIASNICPHGATFSSPCGSGRSWLARTAPQCLQFG